MHRRAAALALALTAAGCHDFDAGPQQCLANGVCRSNIDQDAGTQFEVQVSSTTLTLGPGGIGLVELALIRPRTAPLVPLALAIEGADAGLALSLENPLQSFAANVLAVRVPLPFPAGNFPLRLASLREGTEVASATVTVTVTPPAPTLLVDDNESPDNTGNVFAPPSADDRFYRSALTAPHDTVVLPNGWDGGMGAPLALSQVAGYTSIVWCTGQSFGITNNLTPSDRATLLRWLDLGGKKLILVAQRAPSDVAGGWTGATDPLLRDAIGATGAALRTGDPATIRGSGVLLSLRDNDPLRTDLALINPAPGTLTLLTTTANPDDAGFREIAVATVRANVGDAGTSTVAFVGFPLVNATDAGAAAAAFDAIRVAAGVP